MQLESEMRAIRLPDESRRRNVPRRPASTVPALLIFILMWSTTTHSDEAQREPEDAARFQVIYDGMQKDNSPGTFARGYALVAQFRKDFPDSPYPLLALGEIKYREAVGPSIPGALEEATALAMQAIKLDNKIAIAYILLARIYVERKDPATATSMVNKALSIAPDSPDTLSAMGTVAQANHEFQTAAAWYERAAGKFTDPVRQSNMYMWVYHALSDDERPPMDQRASVEKMEAALQNAIRLHPDDRAKNAAYGCFLLKRKGDAPKARQYLKNIPRGSGYPLYENYCVIMADFLDWAHAHPDGGGRAELDEIASRNRFSIEDAFVNSVLSDGLAPISEAMLRGKVVADVNTLGSGLSRNRRSCCPALVNAAFDDNIRLVKELVDAGANVNAEDGVGRTALFYAIYGADVSIVEYLLQNGARPNVRSKLQETPLYFAVFSAPRNRAELVKVLLKYKANPSSPVPSGQPLAIHAVGMTGQTAGLAGAEILKAFIVDGQMDVNAPAPDGNYFLAVAVYDARQVRFLLEQGADPWVKIGGQNILDFYAPQLSTGFRNSRLNQLETSLKLIQEAQNKNAKK